MADLMGVRAAYKAFKKSQEGKPQEVIDGFTPISASSCHTPSFASSGSPTRP